MKYPSSLNFKYRFIIENEFSIAGKNGTLNPLEIECITQNIFRRGPNMDYMAGLYLKVKVYITSLLNAYNLHTKNLMP